MKRPANEVLAELRNAMTHAMILPSALAEDEGKLSGEALDALASARVEDKRVRALLEELKEAVEPYGSDARPTSPLASEDEIIRLWSAEIQHSARERFREKWPEAAEELEHAEEDGRTLDRMYQVARTTDNGLEFHEAMNWLQTRLADVLYRCSIFGRHFRRFVTIDYPPTTVVVRLPKEPPP